MKRIATAKLGVMPSVGAPPLCETENNGVRTAALQQPKREVYKYRTIGQLERKQKTIAREGSKLRTRGKRQGAASQDEEQKEQGPSYHSESEVHHVQRGVSPNILLSDTQCRIWSNGNIG